MTSERRLAASQEPQHGEPDDGDEADASERLGSELTNAPPHGAERRHELALVHRVRHVEAARDEPRPDRRLAVDEEPQNADQRNQRKPGCRDDGRDRPRVTPPLGQRHRDNRRSRDRPGLVARQAGERQRDERGAHAFLVPRREALVQEHEAKRAEAEQQRLGHRRRLQVEQVGIADHEHAGDRSGEPGPGGRHHQPRGRVREQCERGDGDRHARGAGAIEHVHLHGQHVQQVGQRQPDGADLHPARREAVDHATRDHEVPARIVVAQRQAGAKIHDGRQNPPHRRQCADPQGQGAARRLGYNFYRRFGHVRRVNR